MGLPFSVLPEPPNAAGYEIFLVNFFLAVWVSTRLTGSETPGEGEVGGGGGVYAVTLNPKKSFPNGRIKGAGTLTSDSRLLFETTFCLLD
jgi:hypothetical protein